MKRNKQWLVVMMGLMVCAFFAPDVHAIPSAGDVVKIGYGDAHWSDGGEFLFTSVVTGGAPYSFETFCLETHEYFALGTPYHIYQVSDAAIKGGQPISHPLDPMTAYLYYHFRTDSLVHPYNDTPTASGDLQTVIWFIQGQVGALAGAPNPTEAQTWYTEAYNAVHGGSWGNTLGPVRVINLGYIGEPYNAGYNGGNQDQLTLVPVPEPATMLLLVFGLGGVGFATRRRKGSVG